MDVKADQIFLEDFFGKLMLDGIDAVLCKISFLPGTVHNHMDVRMMPLVMEGSIPMKILEPDFHRIRNNTGF